VAQEETGQADRTSGSFFDGTCLCGALAFRIRAPSKWCAHCHCTLCQRAHGAAFVTWVGVEEGQFALLTSDTLTWFSSSEAAERGFCSACGTSVLFRSPRWPGEIHVARATIPGEIDRAPQAHVFVSSRVSWLSLEDHLPEKG